MCPWFVVSCFFRLSLCIGTATAPSAESVRYDVAGQSDLPYITEFMASNSETLLDGDGRFSDWIEIHNPAATAVGLAGWYLTDDLRDLQKWRFPMGCEVAAGGYLVVFASGKEEGESSYIDSAGYLHTTFRLAREGGDLALIDCDGLSILHAYATYPSQEQDVSYGLSPQEAILVRESAQAAYLVPRTPDEGAPWFTMDYDDSLWSRGLTGIGFDQGPGVTDGLTACWLLDEGTGEIIHDVAGGHNGSLAGQRRPLWCRGPTGQGSALQFFGDGDGRVEMDILEGEIGSEFTLACWVKVPPAAGGQYRAILSKGPKDDGHYGLYLSGTTDAQRTVGEAAMYAPELGDFQSGYVVTDDAWHHLVWTYRNPAVTFFGDGQLVKTFSASGRVSPETESFTIGCLADGSWPFLGVLRDIRIYNRAIEPAEVQSLASGQPVDLETDISTEMLNTGSTVWVRLNFTVSDPGMYNALQLRMKYRDGFIAYLNGVEVARDNAPARTTWCSSSTTTRSDEASRTFCDFDISPALHLLQAGENLLAIHGLNNSPGNGSFLVLPMLVAGVVPSPTDNRMYFSDPTPGQPNAKGYAGLAESPVFSRVSGVFETPFSLLLTGASPRAGVFYTSDGSEPTEFSLFYTEAIPVTSSVEIRARAYEPNRIPSSVVSRLYQAVDSDLSHFSSNLPIVLMDTGGNKIPGTDSSSYARAQSLFLDTDGSGQATAAGPADFAGPVGMRIRGRSSAQFPKKQYKMETWDDKGQDRDVELLGLPSESDWVLHGPYSDKTLMRNYLAYRWWGRMGHYSVRTRFCELFLNDDKDPRMSCADDYVGVYLLVESIKIAKNRADLAQLTPHDDHEPGITGGYIIEMGNANANGFRSVLSGQTVEFSYWDPDALQLTQLQKQWIRNHIAAFEKVLYGPEFTHPIDGYAAYTDVGSQIDYEIMRQFTRNFDGGSTFFYVDRGGKLTMGPLWDYNMAMGNANYAHNDEPGYLTAGWNDSYMAPGVNGWCPWWYRLDSDPDYYRRLVDRWRQLRLGLLSDVNILADVDAAAILLEAAATRNFERWPVLGQYVWANPPGWNDRITYRSEVEWMKQWLLDRAAWLDSQLVEP